MNFVKKIAMFFMTLLLSLSVLNTSSLVYASTAQAVTSSQENMQLESVEYAEVILGALTAYYDSDGNRQVKIVNYENLEKELSAANAPITAKELQEVVERFNYYIVNEDGDGVITDLTQGVSSQLPNPMQRSIITCSNVMGALGLIHSGSYSAAAYLLGVTGPSALVVPVLISTAYYLGSLLC